MNRFSERYRTLPAIELVRVLENQSQYQPEAIEAARDEINDRKLSEQEITDLKSKLHEEAKRTSSKMATHLNVNATPAGAGSMLLDTINPVHSAEGTSERIIRFVTLIFGVVAIVRWYTNFALAKLILGEGAWDKSVLLFFMPLVLLPVGVLMFWKRTRAGWFLMIVALVYSATAGAASLLMTWSIAFAPVPVLDELLPQHSITTMLMGALFYGSAVWLLATKPVREQFGITRQVAVRTIFVSCFLTLLLLA